MMPQLDTSTCSAGCGGKPHPACEYRSVDTYGYGKYETRFKAAKGSRPVTSFFTYTDTPITPAYDWIHTSCSDVA